MKHAVVTGANRGIGLEFCRQLIRQDGYTVIGVCRTASPELHELGIRILEGIDVREGEGVKILGEHLGPLKLDLLVNNAGVFLEDSLSELHYDQIEQQFQVNAVGPLRVTEALLKNLKPGSWVAMVTSLMGSIGDNSSGGSYGYRMSKAALNAASVSLARDLRPLGISIALLHPGYVKTDMTRQKGHIHPQKSVEGMRKVLHSLQPKQSGTFWHTDGRELPW